MLKDTIGSLVLQVISLQAKVLELEAKVPVQETTVVSS